MECRRVYTKEELAEKAPKQRYDQQLKDIRWKFKADNIRIRDNHKCRLCGAKNIQLDVHHIRYTGCEAWDYDDGDLVTLCHKCHEELHSWQDFDTLRPGDYFYSKYFKGVGVVDYKNSDAIGFKGCWTENKHCCYDNHGRLYANDEITREDVRLATSDEIEEFWEKVVKYYNINSIIEYFGEHLKTLLPYNHPVRAQAREYYSNALNTYEEQKKFVKEKFDYFLLVSNSNFAAFQDNRKHDSPCTWPADELPRAFFLVAPKQDVIEQPHKDNSKQVPFNDFDFTGYRAATDEETTQWTEYTDLLFELNKEALPF